MKNALIDALIDAHHNGRHGDDPSRYWEHEAGCPLCGHRSGIWVLATAANHVVSVEGFDADGRAYVSVLDARTGEQVALVKICR